MKQEKQMNAAQMLLLSIGGTAAGQAFGVNRDNASTGKSFYTKRKGSKRVRKAS